MIDPSPLGTSRSNGQRRSRRSFLGQAARAGAATLAADMTALNVLKQPALAAELKRNETRVILFWLAGGASQLETWDPKPGRPTGGPYRAIPTSVPGVHISELMPKWPSASIARPSSDRSTRATPTMEAARN